MSGRVGDLSPAQDAALEQFRNTVDDILHPDHDDYFLLRWLRARKFDVPRAEAMLRTSLQWRQQVGIESLLDEYTAPEVLVKYQASGFLGHDKEGCPVWLVLFGYIDLKGLLHAVKKSDLFKYIFLLLEKSIQDMKDQCEKLGKVIETHSFIFDLHNFTMKQIAWKPALDCIIELVGIYEDNYPELLKKAYVINAPKIFPMAYALLRPFMTDETARKINVFGKENWKAAILEDIDPEVIPAHWGGTRVDPDGNPRCPSVISEGGMVPCSYYMAPTRCLSAEENLKICVVEKKSVLLIEFCVAEPQSIINWEFQTQDYDIGFGVFHRPTSNNNSTNDLEEIIPIQRVNCHLVPEDGMLVCQRAGTYILKFDNTFSWYRRKKLMYHIKILPPDSSQQ